MFTEHGPKIDDDYIESFEFSHENLGGNEFIGYQGLIAMKLFQAAKDRHSHKPQIRADAYVFLISTECDSFCEMIGIEPSAFRKRLDVTGKIGKQGVRIMRGNQY